MTTIFLRPSPRRNSRIARKPRSFGRDPGQVARLGEAFLRGLIAKGPALANPMIFPNLVLNASAGYAAIELGMRGPNFTVCRNETSGEAAVALAYDAIVCGHADVLNVRLLVPPPPLPPMAV